MEQNAKSASEQEESLLSSVVPAGYVKNRVINTIAELDALPLGSVIQDKEGSCYRRAEGMYYDGPHDWQSFDGDFWDVDDFVMPVTLIASNAYPSN